METIIAIVWFLIVTKALFFWLWLWQLKEYHWGRFRAHFETQGFKKALAGFYRIKLPKFTEKTIGILTAGTLLEILFLFWILSLESGYFYRLVFISLIFSPIIFSLFIYIFQIPTVILRKRILKKASEKREKFKDLTVIGITGSYGKTTTKEFLAEILSSRFKVLKTKEHVNAEIGIARAILNELKPAHEVFVAEIGAYNRNKIKEVCKMLRPQIGILTGVSEQHLSTFGSLENIIKAKFELIESLPKNGLAVFNGNNEIISSRFKTFRTGSQLKVKKLVQNLNKVYKRITDSLFPWDRENFSMAVAVAEYLGMSQEEITKAALGIKSPIEIKKGFGEISVMESIYSANPKSVMSHLDYLKNLPGKKVIIMPCLIELGKAAKGIHRRIGDKIGQVCDLAIISTGDYFRELKQGAEEAGMPRGRILLLEKPTEIFREIKSFTSSGDIILLESRVPNKLVRLLRNRHL